MDKRDIRTNDQNRKAMEILETIEELTPALREIYDEVYLLKICYVEGIYRNNFFRQEISVLADAIYGPIEELIGPRDGIFVRRVEAAKDLLTGAYEIKKTRKELGAGENSNGICLSELMQAPDGIADHDKIWEKQKYSFFVVKQMVWNMILESLKDGCFEGQKRKRG